MLWLIAAILVSLWVVGLLTANTMGGLIHLLIAGAVILVLGRVLRPPARVMQKRGDGTMPKFRKQ